MLPDEMPPRGGVHPARRATSDGLLLGGQADAGCLVLLAWALAELYQRITELLIQPQIHHRALEPWVTLRHRLQLAGRWHLLAQVLDHYTELLRDGMHQGDVLLAALLMLQLSLPPSVMTFAQELSHAQ